MTPRQALKEAIRRAGSRAALARAIGITPQAVYKGRWRKGLAPWGQALAIERATGVSRNDLAPKMYPRHDKKGAA